VADRSRRRNQRFSTMSYDPDNIAGNERISRFAYDSGYFRNNGTAKTKAFLPDADQEVSVFRIDDLSVPDIWQLGDAARGRQARASIELTVSAVADTALVVTIAEPPVRHAVIEGWPADDLRMQLQQALADAATVRIR
jgi:hypothetical protein